MSISTKIDLLITNFFKQWKPLMYHTFVQQKRRHMRSQNLSLNYVVIQRKKKFSPARHLFGMWHLRKRHLHHGLYCILSIVCVIYIIKGAGSFRVLFGPLFSSRLMSSWRRAGAALAAKPRRRPQGPVYGIKAEMPKLCHGAAGCAQQEKRVQAG